MKYAAHLISAIEVAVKAGGEILKVYQSDFEVMNKEDQSPVTIADRISHRMIQHGLESHGLPWISEEGRHVPYNVRKHWDQYWIVDPLDGTKEFIKRNGEFTVNIALVQEQKPVLGVVFAPIPQWLYFAAVDIGAFKMSAVDANAHPVASNGNAAHRLRQLMQCSSRLPIKDSRETYTIVGSRSHGSSALDTFVEAQKKERGAVEFIAAGSSLKICLVAEGAADVYPRLGPTMEWDTAAGQAVAECAGAAMTVYESNQVLQYNKESLKNPWFVVQRN